MRYQNKTFTLPVAQGVSKQEWDRIFRDWTPDDSLKPAIGTLDPIAPRRAPARLLARRTAKPNRSRG